jgi:hypothetical protein
MRTGEVDTLMTFLGTLSDPDFLTDPNLKSPYP